MDTIEITTDHYIDLLEDRRSEIKEMFGWEIPDPVWNYSMDLIRECGVNPKYSDPKYVVDNMAVNGDYGDYDDYKLTDETDEEFERRVRDDSMALLGDERIAVFSLG